MLAVVVIGSAVHVIINTFGAWAVQNRRLWIAWSFLVAACILTVATVALIMRASFAPFVLAFGLAVGATASLLHARLVMMRVTVLNHVARVAVGALLVLLAWFAPGE